MIQVAITDDHPVVIEGLKQLINSSSVAEVIGTASTYSECLKMLNKHVPDVLLLDIKLPDGSGIDLCKEITSKWTELAVIAMTSFTEFSIVNQMLNNGAKGYLLKNAMPEEILDGIEMVYQGKRFLCRDVSILIRKESQQHFYLTQRESDMLRLIVAGDSNPEIAQKLCLSVATVNSYRKNLLFKLNVHNTASLVRLAIEKKLV